MFSNGQFDRVAEEDDLPQGVIMPPLLPDGPGFNWFSEGDLISRLADEFSPDFAVEVIEAHRKSYISDEDVLKMKESGVSAVRMPLGYWAFLGGSYNDEPVLYTDPAHEDKKFVTISKAFLIAQVQRFVNEGIDVLLDIHAMPGGSSQGCEFRARMGGSEDGRERGREGARMEGSGMEEGGWSIRAKR